MTVQSQPQPARLPLQPLPPTPRVRAPLEVSGGRSDPSSAHVVDVETVYAGARRYESLARLMGLNSPQISRISHQVEDAQRWGAPIEAVLLEAAASNLRKVALRVAAHVEAREQFAERARAAVALYEDVDAEGAGRFRDVLSGGLNAIPIPAPWIQGQAGWCSTVPRAPGDESGYAPPCAGVDDRPSPGVVDQYAPQELVLGTPTKKTATVAPGVAGVFGLVHDNYGAANAFGAKQDSIDVVKHTYRGADGAMHDSYIVALAGTSRWDAPGDEVDPLHSRTMRPNLEGVTGRPSAESLLVAQALQAAGIPAGSEVLLAGHSQGGMTAMSAAALPAMRAYNVKVLTAGSPVARGRNVPGVEYLHVQNRGDAVPGGDLARNRPLPNQVTVDTGPVRDPLPAHKVDTYEEELRRIDEGDAAGTLPESLDESLAGLEKAGHLRSANGDDTYEVTRFPVQRR